MKTEHALDFEVAPWEVIDGVEQDQFHRFRVGTCDGLWRCTDTSYEILAITNDVPGNGHLTDVLQWFEASCKRDQKDFVILEVWNENFRQHLLKKRGFKIRKGTDDVIKKFKYL